MPLLRRRPTLVRLAAVLVTAAVLGAGQASVASAAPAAAAPSVAGSSAKAPPLSCTIRVVTPTQLYTTSVYTLVEVSCNRSVSFIGGYVTLYRETTSLGSVSVYNYNTSYAYKLNMVSCVPGNYRAMGYGFANLDGGSPDFAQFINTPTVAITCT